MRILRYSSVGKAVACSGCGESTKGVVVVGRQLFHLCPQCRDTKGIFKEVVGLDFNLVLIKSDRSKLVASPIPVGIQIPPMLCQSFNTLSSVRKEIVMDTFYPSIKLDGVRSLLYFYKGEVRVLTRNKAKGTGGYNDITSNFPHFQPLYDSFLEGTVLDSELLFTGDYLDSGSTVAASALGATVALCNSDASKAIALQNSYGFVWPTVFDILIYRGLDLRGLPLWKRLDTFKAVNHTFCREGFNFSAEMFDLVPYTREDKEKLFASVVASGGEGLVMKDPESTYSTKAKSRPFSWVKIKSSYTQDGFITGYKPGRASHKGKVGAIIISSFKRADDPITVVLATISNLTLSLRDAMTDSSGGLQESYIGKVVEISYQEITGKSKRGRHANLVRFRPDKDKEDCTGYSQLVNPFGGLNE